MSKDGAGAVTLRQVAERAGVSVRTVSNVVNDFAYVAATTRARVQQAIDELDYRPNLVARNLRGGRSGIIGVAVPELQVPYFAELCGQIIREAGQHSYTAIIEQTDGNPEEERDLVCRPRRAHLPDGLIFSPLGLGSEELVDLPRTLPMVLLGERVSGQAFDHVGIDNVGAARAATEHLIGIGRHRVAAIGSQFNPAGVTAQYRTEGYRAALAGAGLRYRRELTMPTPRFHRSEGAKAMNRLLDLRRPPDAVFCYNDLLAVGAIRAALSRGVRVPEDIAVAGFDDSEEGQYATPALTTVAPDKTEVARQAVQLLVRRLKGDEQPPVTVVAGYDLRVRESTVTAAVTPIVAVPARRKSLRPAAVTPNA